MAKILVGELRAQKKLTLEQLANISGVSKSHINDIENGIKVPSVDIVCKLAHALNADISDILICD